MRRSFTTLGAGVTLGAALALVAGCGPRAQAPGHLGSEPARIGEAVQYVAAAQRYEQRGKIDEAIEQYRRALQSYRDFPAAWNNLGVLLMEDGRLLESAECFAVASDQAPQDPRPKYNLGLTWDRAGYPADAVEHYRLALRRDARYLPALRGLIRAERMLGQGDDTTLSHLRTALMLEQDPQWREWLELQRLRLETELLDASRGVPTDR